MLRYCIFIAVFQEASESSRLDVYLKAVWSSWQGPLCTCVLQQLLHVQFRHPPWKAFPFLSFPLLLSCLKAEQERDPGHTCPWSVLVFWKAPGKGQPDSWPWRGCPGVRHSAECVLRQYQVVATLLQTRLQHLVGGSEADSYTCPLCCRCQSLHAAFWSTMKIMPLKITCMCLIS